jgi:hypothetical protein
MRAAPPRFQTLSKEYTVAQLQRSGSWARGLTAMAGSLVMGVLGGRLIPPLLAGTIGARRSGAGQDPFERLRRDHRHIRSVLDRMVDAADASGMRRAPLFVVLKRRLAKHALAEEDVVYPLLRRQDGARHGAGSVAMQLYAEHAEIKIHLYELETALRAGGSWRGRIEVLRDLIARHIHEEEDVQFPSLQACLDVERQRVVAGQIHREEALIA